MEPRKDRKYTRRPSAGRLGHEISAGAIRITQTHGKADGLVLCHNLVLGVLTCEKVDPTDTHFLALTKH